jgi:bacteriorhodopsin
MKDVLSASVNTSLFVQWVTMIVNIIGVLLSVKPAEAIVQHALYIETFVQGIQLSFYTWFKQHIVDSPATITPIRYYDWVITTPLMLFTTVLFYAYNSQTEEEKEEDPLTLEEFVRQNKGTIAIIFAFNLAMLAFGYMAEIGVLGLASSTFFGFLALAGSFYTMWGFVGENFQNRLLYGFMLFVWSLYGVAALLKPTWKNVSYNILDVFSKNFYGIFLAYFLLQKTEGFFAE